MKRAPFAPAHWVSLMPNGLGHVKPNHYADMARAAWENRDNLGYAWRILNDGVCDGCALGTTGLRDFTMPGVHLCTVRLNLLRLNTMPALDTRLLADVAALRSRRSGELRALGRLPYPMMRARGEPGFRRVTWDEALDGVAARLRGTDPHRMAFYLTSRGLTNEAYYVAQKAARFLGTSNVDNASRICHSPSTVGMKQALGVAASTCSYKDWIGTDLIVFLGSDAPNNQPVTAKYLYYAKRAGTRIAVVNPYREPGLERYWVPSVFESALFGTRLADAFYGIHTGGDVAFLNGVLKALLESGGVDRAFVDAHTEGFDAVERALAAQPWAMIERHSGATRAVMEDLAGRLRAARSAVFVWSMGITQHQNGVENVKAILNLALARGFVGRERCGLMPIRGHSGVQGGGEMGCVAWTLPGGDAVGPESAAALSAHYGFEVPAWKGLACLDQVHAAHRGELDAFYVVGGNFLETLPDPDYVHEALARPALRVHQDIVLTSQMLVDPADVVVLLPAQTRYEGRGGCTETSTERQIIFSPEIPGPRIGEARAEWEILAEVAARAHPERAHLVRFADAQAIREEIARVVPFYRGIETLRRKGDAVQWGGARLCEGGHFATPNGRARFTPLVPPEHDLPESAFLLKTRRGRQFNSMVHRERDPLNGMRRDDVIVNAGDARALGLAEGDAVVVRSDDGAMRARVRLGPIQPRNVQVHWPEGNVLMRRDACDLASGVPSYKALVHIERAAP